MRDYDWCNEQDWYDVNDETYDFYCKSSAREMKPRPITVNKPLRVIRIFARIPLALAIGMKRVYSFH